MAVERKTVGTLSLSILKLCNAELQAKRLLEQTMRIFLDRDLDTHNAKKLWALLASTLSYIYTDQQKKDIASKVSDKQFKTSSLLGYFKCAHPSNR